MYDILRQIKHLPINRRLLTSTVIFIVISTLLEMILMAVIYALLSQTTGVSESGIVQKVFEALSLEQIGWIALVATSLKLTAAYIAIHHKSRLIFFTQTTLANDLYKNHIQKRYAEVEKKSAAELVRIVANESHNVVKMVFLPLVSIISELFPALAIASFAVAFKPMESIISFMLVTSVGYSVHRFYKCSVVEWGNIRRQVEEKITAILIDSDRLFREISVYKRQTIFVERFRTEQNKLAEVGQKQNFAAEIPRVILETLVFSGMIFYFFCGIIFYDKPLEAISTVAVIGLTALRVIPSVHRILSAINTIRYGLPSLEKIVGELRPGTVVSDTEFTTVPVSCPSLEVINLSYKRSDSDPKIFSDISFVARKGEIIGVKGASGSGKSTFLNVIMGLLTPTSGKILLNGKDVSQVGLYNSTSVGIVPQQGYIFNGSILENLSLYDLSPEDWKKRVNEALKTANILDFVNRFEQKLDKNLSENSKDVSGGQAQRLTIARSLFNNPEILLFDEFTSALDLRTQTDLISELRAIVKEKIVIIVSHSTDVLTICDRIIDLGKGLPPGRLDMSEAHAH